MNYSDNWNMNASYSNFQPTFHQYPDPYQTQIGYPGYNDFQEENFGLEDFTDAFLDDDIIDTLQILNDFETFTSEDFLDSEEVDSTNSSENSKKKRKPIVRSEEARERRNQRRRVNFYPRILKRDIRRDYMNYYANVMNSSDFALMDKYLDRFYHPNVVMAKSEYSDPNSSQLPTVFQVRGKSVVSNLFRNKYHDLPDFVLRVKNTTLRVDPKTNRSLIKSSFVIQATRVKSPKSLFVSMIERMTKIVEGTDDITQYEIKDEAKKNISSVTEMYSNLIDPQHESKRKVMEFEQDDYFKHRIDVLSGNKYFCASKLEAFLTNYYPIYKETMDNLSKLPSVDEDPIVFFNPQIKTKLEGEVLMFLDENLLISHIETRLASLDIEPVYI